MLRPDPFALRALLGPTVSPCRRALTGEQGVSLPPLVDHHVHLHLIDEQALASGGIAGVVDLGGDPAVLARRPSTGMPRTAYAGAFLTAPGGYPAGRSWAPPSTVRIVSDPSTHPGVEGGAATAVDDQASFGASVIKVALNAATGPVFDQATLAAIVACAHARELPVVAHVEGEGMTLLALDAGVDVLAHTPFSEELSPALITGAVESGQAWISTIAIHSGANRARALANLSAFLDAGGTVLYGTDLGNGDLPLGVNALEVDALHGAGLQGAALVRALADPWPLPPATGAVATFVSGEAPDSLDAVPAWLARATVVPTEELIHDDH